jgi:hypothetical protein
MKKLLFVIFLVKASYSDAQTTIEKFIELKDSTIAKTVTFDIKKGASIIKCSVKSFLSGGELSFKILDPEGKVEGRFWLDTINDGESKPSSGRMTHEGKSPLAGTWKLQIQTTGATGNLNYKIYFN